MPIARLSLALLGIVAVLLAPVGVGGDEPALEKRPVFVEICVADISVKKLKSFGLDWDLLVKRMASADAVAGQPDDQPVDAIKFLRALGEINLVQIVAHPRLATVSDRPASFSIGDKEAGDAVNVTVAPEVTEQGKIRLKYDVRIIRLLPVDENLAVFPPLAQPRGKRTLMQSATVELTPGQTVCVSNPSRHEKDKKRQQHELTTVVFVRADLQPPSDIRTAEKLPPRPVLDGRLRDVELPKR